MRNWVFYFLLPISLTNCASLTEGWLGMGDSDDAPQIDRTPETVGGVWPERNTYLSQSNVGRGRGLASSASAGSLVDQDFNELSVNRRMTQEDGSVVHTRASDLLDENQTEGSLWASEGQTNYFFTKNRTRTVGDIVSIKIDDQFLRGMANEIRKTLTNDELKSEIEMLKSKRNLASTPSVANAKDKVAAATADIPTGENPIASDIDLSERMGLKSGDTVFAEIVERYPNGNYRLRGLRQVPYRGTLRDVGFVAIVRSTDIEDSDQIGAEKIYEYRIRSIQ